MSNIFALCNPSGTIDNVSRGIITITECCGENERHRAEEIIIMNRRVKKENEVEFLLFSDDLRLAPPNCMF